MAGPSIVQSWFEFISPLQMAAGVAVSEAAVSARMWSMWAAQMLPGKAVHPALS